MLCVGGEQDRLDPVAGAEVERSLAFAANGQVRERDGRTVHARHVICIGLCPTRVVGRDQQLVVRDEARRAVDDFAVLDEQPGAREAGLQPRAHEFDRAVCV